MVRAGCLLGWDMVFSLLECLVTRSGIDARVHGRCTPSVQALLHILESKVLWLPLGIFDTALVIAARGPDVRAPVGSMARGMMVSKVNLNADMAEGFGAYDIGNDAALMPIVRSANIACGFHGGDFVTMQHVVTLAAQHGVSIGAHPGFNDLWGFGRRRIEMDLQALEYMVAYQIGALQAIACYADRRVTHVKPHGALNNMAAEDGDMALAIARAAWTIDRNLIFVAPAGSALERAGRRLGLPVAREGFADRRYEDDGTLTPRKRPGAVIRDPDAAAAQAVQMARDGTVVTRQGKTIGMAVDTLCVHGDEASAVMVAEAVRTGLRAAGLAVVPLPDILPAG